MNPQQARALLLEQHERLRHIISSAEGMAGRLLCGEAVGREFHELVSELLRALAEHNQAEEGLLEPILEFTDEVGPRRVARMHEEHRAEHAAMRAVLLATDAEIARGMADFCEELRAHMEAEERTFLHPRAVGAAG